MGSIELEFNPQELFIKKLVPTYDAVLRAVCNGKFLRPSFFGMAFSLKY